MKLNKCHQHKTKKQSLSDVNRAQIQLVLISKTAVPLTKWQSETNNIRQRVKPL